jgi:hypothetical protein
LAPTEEDIGGRQVVEALVVAPQVVVIDELDQALFELTRQVVVLEQDLVFIERWQRSILPWVIG